MTQFKPIPSVEFLRERYSYDPATGVLVSKYGRHRGNPITQREQQGYVVLRINRDLFKAHRVIWKMVTGHEPPEEIDHEDKDRANNRWDNLRDASKAENQHNRRMQRTNKIGLKGVCWHKRDQRWSTEIRVNNRRIWLGYFPTAEAAHAAYCEAASTHFGEFANHGKDNQ